MASAFSQITSSATPRALVGGGDQRITGRARLKASTNTVFLGHNSSVTASTGVQLPSGDAAAYLEIDVENPDEVFVVGTGVVYVIFE